jgi:hypothetical protein
LIELTFQVAIRNFLPSQMGQGGPKSPVSRHRCSGAGYWFSSSKRCADGNGEETGHRQYIHNFMRLRPAASCTKGQNVLRKMAKIVAGVTMINKAATLA